MTPASFDEVLAAARAGHEWAWAQIHRSLAPGVLGYLRARRAVDPEDVLGDTLLDVFRGLDRFEGDERAFRAWVFTIAHRRLTDAVRARARRNAEPAPDGDLMAAAPMGDAEQEALDGIATRDIQSALRRLSSDQQAVLLLRLFGGFSIAEIAGMLGKQAGAVKALQRRGLDSLRKVLEDPVPFSPLSSISR